MAGLTANAAWSSRLGRGVAAGQHRGELWQKSSPAVAALAHHLLDASAYDTRIAAEVKQFDPTQRFPTPRKSAALDRYSQFGIYAAPGKPCSIPARPRTHQSRRAGVFLGSGIGGWPPRKPVQKPHCRGAGRLSPFTIPMAHPDMASGLFSCTTNARPELRHLSACATGNHAIGEAWRTIKWATRNHVRRQHRSQPSCRWASAASAR